MYAYFTKEGLCRAVGIKETRRIINNMRNREKWRCDCGALTTLGSYQKHVRTFKHCSAMGLEWTPYIVKSREEERICRQRLDVCDTAQN